MENTTEQTYEEVKECIKKYFGEYRYIPFNPKKNIGDFRVFPSYTHNSLLIAYSTKDLQYSFKEIIEKICKELDCSFSIESNKATLRSNKWTLIKKEKPQKPTIEEVEAVLKLSPELPTILTENLQDRNNISTLEDEDEFLERIENLLDEKDNILNKVSDKKSKDKCIQPVEKTKEEKDENTDVSGLISTLASLADNKLGDIFDKLSGLGISMTFNRPISKEVFQAILKL